MAGGGGSRGGGGGGGGGTMMPPLVRPRIRSFSYMIPKYVSSLRAVGGGGGGGGGGGRGGGGGGGMGGGGNAGSTKIISILPEGTSVKPGDLVAELDSSTFRTALESQKIRVTGVKSDLEQVKKTLEVAEIGLEEFRDGVFPQDKMLLNQYIAQCELRTNQSMKTLAWSKDQVSKGLRSDTQLRADENDNTKNKIMLEEAMGMQDRLEKFTSPRIMKELQAKIEAVRTDLYAIQKAYQLEVDRQKKLEEMIVNCKMVAPRDGIVVYANESNMWGRSEAQIAEGATVREGQAVFKLPNPSRMLVKAQINESKISYIQKGQRTQILVDAFNDRPMTGTVTEITAIPAPPKGFSADIRAYVATVSIEQGGFDGLRPGMAAEISFDVSTRDNSLRLPVDSIMFVNEKPFVAVPFGTTFQWRSVEIGMMNESYAEVKTGITEGELIVAAPGRLTISLPQVEPVVKKAENNPANPVAPAEPAATAPANEDKPAITNPQ
jgi:multidrug efflux pump subunit AcrA (membrane-fusion protein)